MTKRGDVVLARFPYVGGAGSKNRPAVVVKCDRLNGKIRNTVLAMITGNLRLVSTEPTQFLIDPGTPDGASSGLTQPSAVKCENLMTVAQVKVFRRIGELSASAMRQIEAKVTLALELP